MSDLEPLHLHNVLDSLPSALSPALLRSSDGWDDLSALDHFLADLDDSSSLSQVQEQFAQGAAPSHAGGRAMFTRDRDAEVGNAAQRHRRAIAIALRPRLPKTKKQAPKRRTRPKHQLDMLRVVVLDLQHKLDTLRVSAAEKKSATRNRERGTKSVNEEAPDRMNRANTTNVRLRKMIKQQLSFSYRLADVLTKSDNSQPSSDVPRLHKLHEESDPDSLVSNADSAFLFEALSGKLDAIFAQTGRVFASNDLFQSIKKINDTQAFLEDEKQMNVHIRDLKVMPFELEAVSDALWRRIKTDLGGGVDGAEACRLQVAARSVGKRFLVSKDRIVVCWEGLAEWPREVVEPSGVQSIPMQEQGWVLVRRVPGHPGMSVMQVCMKAKPGVSTGGMPKRDRPGQLKSIQDLVIPSYQQLFNSRYQAVENMLFDSKPSESE